MNRLLSLIASLFLAGCVSVTINIPAAPTSTVVPSQPATLLYTETPLYTETALHMSTATPFIGSLFPSETPTPPGEGAFPFGTPTPQDLGLTPTPTAYIAPPTDATPTPNYLLSLTPPPDGPPRALYFLADHGVWVLRPRANQAERLTAKDTIVTAFDVWPDGGRIAFATKSGKLYTQIPGKDPLLLVKLDDSPYPAYINGLDWSPDGSQLAYSVVYDNGEQPIYAPYPSRPSGVWIAPLKDGKPTWVMSSRYPQSKDSAKAADYRRFSAPEWSPDGQALIIHADYWESTNTHWIYPLQFAADDSNLHTLPATMGGMPGGNPGATWGHAAWTPDSQGLVFSSQENVTFGDLAYAPRTATRDNDQAVLWQGGQMANLYIADAHMVPNDAFLPGPTAGINAGPGRMVYIADCPNCAVQPAAGLIVEKSALIDPSMNGTVLEPMALCHKPGADGNIQRPRTIEWTPDYSRGVLACGANEIYLVNLHRDPVGETDLLPVLPALAPQDAPIFRWGELQP